MDSFTMQKDLHPLFAPFCNLQSAHTISRRLWREVRISTSPVAQDLKRRARPETLHAPTRDISDSSVLSSIYTGEDLPPPVLQSTAALGRRFAT